ncbi:MAG: hypothetical protein HC923_13045 [Myxococcales bacterium]|nr:hypothetical protein [Myxococcales bacterium]
MRIAYGVHGYTRGHATRAASILDDLMRSHEVLVLAGGDAHEASRLASPVTRIETLGFSYGKPGKLSKIETLRRNVPKLWDLFAHGPEFARVTGALKQFRPDVVISDAEAWTHRAALALGVPRIGFDHFGVMVYCKVPMNVADRIASLLDRTVYRTLMGLPEKVLVSSFYPVDPHTQDVDVVGPMVGDDVFALEPSVQPHLLVYLNMGIHQWTPRIERALMEVGVPCRVYGPGLGGHRGNLTFFEPNRSTFLQDLASCRAVITTAGNQLVGEAMHLGKPLLVMPEATVEQRMNAAAVERLGIGQVSSFARIDAEVIRAFLSRRDEFAAATRQHAQNGRIAAMERLERWFQEFAGRRALPASV